MALRPVIIALMRFLKPARKSITRCVTRKSTSSTVAKKMDGAGGLPAAEDSDYGRKYGRNGGRHGEPGRDHQREQDKDYGQIREPLQYVIRPGSAAPGGLNRR